MEVQKQQLPTNNTKNNQLQQHTVICFCYNVTIYISNDTSQSIYLKSVSDILRSLTEETSNQFKCEINVSNPEFLKKSKNLHEFQFTIVIVGLPNQAVDAKGYLMRKNPSQTESTLSVVKNLILKDNGEMKSDFKRRLDEIMAKTKTTLNVSKSESDSNLNVEIMGGFDNVDEARLQCLVALDVMSGLHSETLVIDKRLLTIIAGKKRETLNTVMQDTLTNIYFPPYLQMDEVLLAPQLNDTAWNNDLSHKTTVYITGLKDNTLIAKSQLCEIAENKKSSLLARTVVCLSRKLDWLVLNHKEKLKKIMSDNATVLILPKLGGSSNTLTVIGDERIFVERSIRMLMIFICGFYVACIRRQPITQTSSAQGMYKIQQPHYNGDRVATVTAAEYDSKGDYINDVIQNICKSSCAEVILQPQYVEMCGLQSAVKNAYEALIGTEFFRTSRDSKFQLELAVAHREFINGKKNGKINKIIKTSASKISFQDNFNGYNMLIEIQNMSPLKSLEGLTLLEDEMPAEISFYVPEIYHKRIIGVGGKNIQKIMKKYGVYVKFSNSEEFQLLGGYYENMDNVIARTPAKNAFNLNEMKMAIIEIITTKENFEKKTTVKIPRQHHKVVIGLQGCNIAEIERKTNVHITFPDVESGLDDFVLHGGDEVEVQQAEQLLLDLVPEVCEIQVPSTTRAKKVIESMDFFSEIVQKLKVDKGLLDYFFYFPMTNNVSPILRPSEIGNNSVVENLGSSVISIIIHFNPRISSSEEIKSIINKFLTSREVNLNQEKVISRVGSVASSNAGSFNLQNVPRTASCDSFQHFNSKLIAPVTQTDHINPVVSSTYSLFDGPNKAFDFSDPRNPKQTHSAPNLRSFFEDAIYPSGTSQTLMNGQPILRSNLSESYNHMFARNSSSNVNTYDGDGTHDDNFNTQFDILGDTLAATSFSGLSQEMQKRRNLLNPSRPMDSSVFGQMFTHNTGSNSDPSLNFWRIGSKQNSSSSVIDENFKSDSQQQQQPIPRIPADNVGGLQLNRSDPNNNTKFEEKTKQRAPSKLRQHFDAEQISNEKPEPKRWGNIAGINPHAPSFEPSSSNVLTTFESSFNESVPKHQPQKILSYTNAVLQNTKKSQSSVI